MSATRVGIMALRNAKTTDRFNRRRPGSAQAKPQGFDIFTGEPL
jgi:hypothetical protein